MNFITSAIQKLVIRSNTEEALVNLRRRVNFIRKLVPVSLRHKFASIGRFIPKSTDYPSNDCYSLTRDNTHFKINRSDYVQWRLFYGVRDNALREAKKHLESGSIVLDIGANIGAFSLKLATYIKENGYAGIQVHAFEPNPDAFRSYADNLSLNPALADIVNTHRVGLGNKAGESSFEYPDNNTGVGRVLQDGIQGQFTVTIQRLDDFISSLNPSKIAFIKLIVEGFEPEVFRGGWETIKKYRPPIFFEVNEKWWGENNSTTEEVLNELRALGYKFKIEEFNEMLPYEPGKYDPRIQFNLMATIVQ